MAFLCYVLAMSARILTSGPLALPTPFPDKSDCPIKTTITVQIFNTPITKTEKQKAWGDNFSLATALKFFLFLSVHLPVSSIYSVTRKPPNKLSLKIQ